MTILDIEPDELGLPVFGSPRWYYYTARDAALASQKMVLCDLCHGIGRHVAAVWVLDQNFAPAMKDDLVVECLICGGSGEIPERSCT